MNECHFSWCKHHAKSDPYCNKEKCTASTQELAYFLILQRAELETASVDRVNKEMAEYIAKRAAADDKMPIGYKITLTLFVIALALYMYSL